jgi:hypothetical protein
MINYILIFWYTPTFGKHWTSVLFLSCDEQEKAEQLANNDDWKNSGLAYFPQRHD